MSEKDLIQNANAESLLDFYVFAILLSKNESLL